MSEDLDARRRAFDQDPSDETARQLAQVLARTGAFIEAFFLLFDRGVEEGDALRREIGAAIAARQRPVLESLGEELLCALRVPPVLEEFHWAWQSLEDFLAARGREPVLGLKFHRRLRPEDFTKLLALETLVGLDLEHGLRGEVAIEELARLPRLRYLNIAASRGSQSWLMKVRSLSSLRSLVCRDLPLTEAVLAAWSPLKELRHLDLTNTTLSSGDLAHLAAFPKLETLDLCSTATRDDDLEALLALPRLRRLNLIATGVGEGCGAILSRLTGLRELDLDYSNLGDEGFAPLASLTSLRRLSLRQTRLTSRSMPLFAGLENLEDLCLNGAVVGGGDESWALPRGLVCLDLGGTGANDADLAKLSELGALEVLSLFSCPISDAGLASLSGLSSLEDLNLSFTAIDGSGLPQLEGLPALLRLRVTGCDVDREALRVVLPQVEDWD